MMYLDTLNNYLSVIKEEKTNVLKSELEYFCEANKTISELAMRIYDLSLITFVKVKSLQVEEKENENNINT